MKFSFKKILLLGFTSLVIYVSYEVYLKYVINDFQIAQIEKELVKNYEKHPEKFDQLVALLANVENFEVESYYYQNEINLFINHVDYYNYEELYQVRIEGDSAWVNGTALFENEVGQLVSESILFDRYKVSDWTIDYRGSLDSKMSKMLLQNRRISQQKLRLILELLKQTNCLAISKYNDSVEIRYRGHKLDCFKYIYQPSSENMDNLTKIAKNLYWQHYEASFYCNWTNNWGWI
ncbi:MAG: hypothetical protein NXI20_00700 [bacterium]|nr:hypothetical protein [bacterium]